MTLPAINESSIRARASNQSFQRGETYLGEGVVGNVVWRGQEHGILTAEVYGSDYDPYQVQITVHDNEIVEAGCSCPYDMGGDCKHIVATLLFVLRTPGEVKERQPIDTLFEGLSGEQLTWILRMLLEQQPGIVDAVEALVGQISASSSATTTDSTPAQTVSPDINRKWLSRRIEADM